MIDWTQELRDSIIQGLETQSLRKLCASNPDLPDRSTITDYMAKDTDFASKCARAREDHAEVMDDKILEVAEKVERGVLDPKAGSVVISAYQWRASKLKPKKYGERIQQEHSGEVGIKTILVPTPAKSTAERPARSPEFEE